MWKTLILPVCQILRYTPCVLHTTLQTCSQFFHRLTETTLGLGGSDVKVLICGTAKCQASEKAVVSPVTGKTINNIIDKSQNACEHQVQSTQGFGRTPSQMP